jgi:hypothetical protein
VSGETMRGWSEGGAFQLLEDIYKDDKFTDNDRQRLVLKVDKNWKIHDLLCLIRKKSGYRPSDLLIYRVKSQGKKMYYDYTNIASD